MYVYNKETSYLYICKLWVHTLVPIVPIGYYLIVLFSYVITCSYMIIIIKLNNNNVILLIDNYDLLVTYII